LSYAPSTLNSSISSDFTAPCPFDGRETVLRLASKATPGLKFLSSFPKTPAMSDDAYFRLRLTLRRWVDRHQVLAGFLVGLAGLLILMLVDLWYISREHIH